MIAQCRDIYIPGTMARIRGGNRNYPTTETNSFYSKLLRQKSGCNLHYEFRSDQPNNNRQANINTAEEKLPN